jgi:hypothetical protein
MAWQRILIAPVMLVLASTACIISDAKDAVDTASRAISLLSEIAESGTWTYITEGLEALDTAGGFSGTVDIVQGTSNATGDAITETSETIHWDIQVDADDDVRITEVDNDTVITVVTVDGQSYLEENGSYSCLNDQQGETVFARNLDDAFASYGALAAGVQAISIAEEDGTETINGRNTTRYRLVSKLEEAIEILSEFPSDELRESIEDVPEFYVDGALFIDQETSALMRFNATYADLEENEGTQFTFEVTQLGNQPDISIDPSQITQACPQGGAGQTTGN